MSTIAGISACLFGNLLFTLAPIPPEPSPDPMGRGYMGITVQTGALMIESVQPGLPAAKSGLRSGDVLLRVGTLEPREFEQVVSHICSFRPGAVVEIEVQRGSERKTFRVKLASRPPELDLQRNPNRPIDIDD
ncbi:MAG: PDZ domain-containing protein [Planctomycetes bacterium]|nr:PDZ domain-containing protein [Planctomycetota bacterium]